MDNKARSRFRTVAVCCARAFQESCIRLGQQLRIYTIGVLYESVNADHSVWDTGRAA